MASLFHTVLAERFGFTSFRPGQLEALEALFTSNRLLCIQPTGHGKSLLYQLPACILPGIVLVISPLLALMRDQVDQLNQRFSIRAGSINSDQTEEENGVVRSAAAAGELKILFVSPEQLDQIDRFDFFLSLPLSLIVIDEAHCVSTWGHDFRPAYRQILHLVKRAEEQKPGLKILGLTATAAAAVEKDILEQLFSQSKPGTVLRECMDRPNLHLSAYPVQGIASKLLILEELLKRAGTGLIYCATRENTELVAAYLQKQGLSVAAYHAGLDPEEKRSLQKAFLKDDFRAIAATNALGMGIDKPNIRFVFHFDVPGSITAYYQEVGRAGRDGKEAEGILLFDEQDRHVQEYFICSAVPEEGDFRKVLEIQEPSGLSSIKQITGLHPTRVNVVVAELVEQGFLVKEKLDGKQVYRKTEVEKFPDLRSFEMQKQVKLKELGQMLEYARGTYACRMAFLRRVLGDKDPPICHHCDRCTPLAMPSVEQQDIQDVNQWINIRPLTIPAARMAGLSEGISFLSSKHRSPLFVRFMKTRQEAEEIDPEWLPILKAHLKPGLAAAVIPLPSVEWKGRLAMAKAVAELLEVPLFTDLLVWKEIPQQRQGSLLNNDQRRANVQKKMEATGPLPQGPLLLLDDCIGSGATLKEAARALHATKTKKLVLIPLTLATIQWRLGSPGFI